MKFYDIGRNSDTNTVMLLLGLILGSARAAQACTALAFNLHRKSEFLVALADYSVKCFDTGKKFYLLFEAE